jgi:hypothetical protein
MPIRLLVEVSRELIAILPTIRLIKGIKRIKNKTNTTK